MRRLIWSTLLGVLTLLVIATPALAGKIWCARDPMVSLNGNDVQIWVAIPAEYQSYVTGPIDFDILTPKGVSQQLVFTDTGFNGYGEDVSFGDFKGKVAADGSFLAQVRVRIPIDSKALAKNTKIKQIPVQLRINQGAHATQVVEMTNDGTWLTFTVLGNP